MKLWSKVFAAAMTVVLLTSVQTKNVIASEEKPSTLQEIDMEIESLEIETLENETTLVSYEGELESLERLYEIHELRKGILHEELGGLEEKFERLRPLTPNNLLQAAVLTIAQKYVVLTDEEVATLVHEPLAAFDVLEGQYLLRDSYKKVEEALLDKQEALLESFQRVTEILEAQVARKEFLTTEVQVLSEEVVFAKGSIETLKDEKTALAEKIKAEEAYRKSTTFIWPTYGRFTSGYGYRTHPVTRSYSFHGGIDIANGTGTPIVASQSGRVVFSGWQGAYGRLIIIRHNSGLETAYAHLSGSLVSPGQWVEQGQQIGRMGNTGRSTGSHLHFEIRSGGSALNPMNYLQ